MQAERLLDEQKELFKIYNDKLIHSIVYIQPYIHMLITLRPI